MHALAPLVIAVMFVSLLLDSIAVPRAPWRRHWSALALHASAIAFIGALVMLVTARPIFSSCIALAVTALLSVVSNAKYESLREPFVFTDLSLFSQLFEHPRLYLPFLSVGKVVSIGFGVIAVVAGFVVEKPLPSREPMLIILTVVASMFAATRLAARLPLALDPVADQGRFGFFAVFVAYLLNGLRRSTFLQLQRVSGMGLHALGEPEPGPDVILIQSESFFDIRRIGVPVDPRVYENFDRIRWDAVVSGELTVPAWGANTMRTEFAMLTGLTQADLGYARFYPYAFLRRAFASLATWFVRAGYSTIAIHPYYAGFFGRRRAFSLLGFERFLDIAHFADSCRAGAYIADDAVADKIIDQLKCEPATPIFIFAMTMENHGPLHLEQVRSGEAERVHGLGEAPIWRDLTAYLRHVENADRMIRKLTDYLLNRSKPTVLCFYGDHVPALPAVYAELGRTPTRSNYFVWRNYGDSQSEQLNVSVEKLGLVLRNSIHSSEAGEATALASQMTIQK
ncbi:LTA synthase family protein [Burkholderia ambifaria]|uniref:LTA synthase family protein n=1 Tax=Burkholderia ambifaria TaxID=152480 RepID=UPI001589978B|nr:LTA synthase family protein [Burkholderia ambifaria]